MKKRILSMLLAVVMVLTISPSALADGGTGEESLNILNLKVNVTTSSGLLEGDITGVPCLCTVDSNKKVQVNGVDSVTLESYINELMAETYVPGDDNMSIEDLLLLVQLLNATANETITNVTTLHASLKAPDGYEITALGDGSIAGIPALTFTIPATVTTIGDNVFGSSIMDITIEDSNPYFSKSGNGLFLFYNSGNEKELIWASPRISGSIEIPAGTTAIGSQVFFGREEITAVSIPGSVTKIGASAFEQTGLTSVTFSEGLVDIGDAAFYDTPLTAIDLPGTLKTIGDNAFSCTDLTAVTIPEGVTSIGSSFSACENLASVTFPAESLIHIGNSAFSTTALTFVEIPASVKTLGSYAFSDCTNLQTVTFGDNSALTSIGASAFRYTSLTEFSFPSGVTVIADELLTGTDLTEITIPDNITSIGKSAFAATNLTEVSIPASVESIGDYAFDYCTTLREVTFSEDASLTSIGEWAFGRTALTSVSLPEGLITIDNSAFRECKSLESVTLPTGLETIGKWAFYIGDNASSGSLSSVTIPHGVTTIGQRAFFNQRKMASIVLPATLSSLGESAFGNVSAGNPNSPTLTFLGGTPPEMDDPINNLHAYSAIYVPKGTGDAYYTALKQTSSENFDRAKIKETLTTASFDANGGTGTMEKQGVGNDGVLIIPDCAFTRPGYVFEGWALDAAGNQRISGSTTTLTKDTTLYAIWKWEDPTINVSYSYNSSAFADIGVYKFVEGADIEMSVAVSHADTISCTYKWYSVETSADLADYATKGVELDNTTSAISIADAAVGTDYRVCVVTVQSQTSDESSEKVITLSATINKADGPAAPAGLTATKPSECGAQDGKITGVDTTMEYSSSEDFASKTACTGTEITGLASGTYYVRVAETGTHKAGAAATVVVPHGDCMITVSATPTAGGTVDGSGTYSYGASVTLTATPNTGYSFVNWTEGGETVSTSTEYTFNANESCTLVANFELNSYTVTFVNADGTELQSSEVAYGETPAYTGETPTKAADDHYTYTFDCWTPEITAVTGEATYAATYTATRIEIAPSDPTYPVVESTSEDPNGTVIFNKKYAYFGETVTVMVSADPYYSAEKIIVRDMSGKEVETTENADGSYSFKMPSGKVTVEAVYVWENPFVDVVEDTFYIDAVEWALKNGITKGTSETTFEPEAECTRAQMVTFLWRAAGCPEPTTKDCSFTDVDAESYYGKAVLWAVENGITNGTSATTFSPDMECSRAQMAAFLCRMADGKAEGDENPFVDVADDAYYADSVLWAFENGITEGTGEGKYSPSATCTRAQMVTFLYRYYVK